jgi:hypothetical protein
MEQVRQLRDKADHCMRLSRYISNPTDVAGFEALAASFDSAAEKREAEAEAWLAAGASRRPD